MPTRNSNGPSSGKTTNSNTGSANKNSRSNKGLVNSMPSVPKARDRAKDIDFKRRGDAESNEL